MIVNVTITGDPEAVRCAVRAAIQRAHEELLVDPAYRELSRMEHIAYCKTPEDLRRA